MTDFPLFIQNSEDIDEELLADLHRRTCEVRANYEHEGDVALSVQEIRGEHWMIWWVPLFGKAVAQRTADMKDPALIADLVLMGERFGKIYGKHDDSSEA